MYVCQRNNGNGERCVAIRGADGGTDQSLSGLYLLEGVPVTVCAVATVAWEGSPGVAVFG
jgi:hypothetical protein